MTDLLTRPAVEAHTGTPAGGIGFPFTSGELLAGGLALAIGVVLCTLGSPALFISPVLFIAGMGMVVTVLGLGASWVIAASVR